MHNPSISVKLTKYLVFINALIWLVFAIIVAAGFHPAIPHGPRYRWGITILALLTSVFLIGDYRIMMVRGGFAYYFLLGMLALISLLTITDEFGVVDLIVFLFNLLTFILLIKDRRYYLQRG
jgi:hypothetical protein